MWTPQEKKVLAHLNTPAKIQQFLDDLPYDSASGAKSPRRVLREKKAHCFGGALLAAAALEFHGHPPCIVDLQAVNDDDHILAVFKKNGKWGAIAKSNFTTLRFREPVYASLRELIMSYFDFYFNTHGEKTLRAYSVPISLRVFVNWQFREELLDDLDGCIDKRRHFRIVANGRSLSRVSTALLNAGLSGANAAGLYKPD